MLRTCLVDEHIVLNAKMVEFAGWEMPVQYTGIVDEAKAVRNRVGMFDVSHMGRVWLNGSEVFNFLQKLTVNDIDKLADNQAQYSLMCYPEGGVVDDIIVYRLHSDEYLIVWNASNREKNMAWVQKHLSDFPGITVKEGTLETGMIAVQGPASAELLDELSGQPLSSGERFSVQNCTINGSAVTACRTGYTGEDGFELICSSTDAPNIWKALLDNGVVPCGLAARDVLRVEAGFPLYGHEISIDINPISAGLGWVVSKTKSFIGSDPINKARAEGTSVKLTGIAMESKIVPREGYPVYLNDCQIGKVSSGVYSPMLDKGIAFAFINAKHSAVGQSVAVEIREKMHPAVIVGKRFLKDINK